MAGTGLIVKDSEFIEAGVIIKSFSNAFQSAISQYLYTLNSIYNNAVMSGNVHDALYAYIQYVNKIVNIPGVIGNKFSKMTTDYISQMDSADSFLYEKSASVIRDFTQEERKKLEKLLDDPWCDFTDSAWDWVLKKLQKLGFYDVSDPKADLDAVHRALLDINNYDKEKLNHLFEQVDGVENKFGQSIAGASINDGNFYTCHFSNAWFAFLYLGEMIEKMAEIIAPNSGKFTAEYINTSLESIYQKLHHYVSEVVSIVSSDEDMTVEQIEEFAESYLSALFFAPFMNAINMFLADLGGREQAMMTVFNMFDIAEGQILNDGEYEKAVMKDELMDILKDMADHYDYSGSDEEKIVSDCKDFLKYVKKYGSGWYKYMNTHYGENGKLLLDGRTKQAEKFKKYLDSLGNAGKILEYGGESIDLLSKIFTDYSKNLDILNSFISNQSFGDEMNAAALEIKALYEKELNGILNEALQKIKEIGFKKGMAYLAKSIPPLAVVETVKQVIGTVGDISGLGTKGKAMYNALIYSEMYYSCEDSYQNALSKVREAIKQGKNTGEEYKQLIENLKNCFNLTKNTLQKMFLAMADSTTGKKSAYYRYCYNRAVNARMVNDGIFVERFDVLSYEEYLNVF